MPISLRLAVPSPFWLLGLIPVAAIPLALVPAAPASALTTTGFDSTLNGTNCLGFNNPSGCVPNPSGSTSRSVSSTNLFMRVFNISAGSFFLDKIRVALGTVGSTRNLQIDLVTVSGAGSNASPYSSASTLGSMVFSYTQPSNSYRLFNTSGTLAQQLLTSGVNYGLVFRSTDGTSPNLLRCAVAAGCPAMQQSGTNVLGASASTNSGTSWSNVTDQNALVYLEAQLTPSPAVPAPALMGFGAVSGLLLQSRRLRSRIARSRA